ncbi:hypothetical protein DXG01_004302 [Tephrocybe rancida]|nr:hypothetical protein DXG01_004302 [Tephrocybe rancida]
MYQSMRQLRFNAWCKVSSYSESGTRLISSFQTCAKVPTDSSCGCSVSAEQGFVDCLNCILGSNGIPPTFAGVESVQVFVDQYVETCNIAGVNLPATTLSGGVSGITSTRPGNTPTSGSRPAFTSATAGGNPFSAVTAATDTLLQPQTVTVPSQKTITALSPPSETSSAGVSGSTVLSSRDLLKPLLSRQTGLTNIPTQCQTSCNAISVTLQTCTTTACLCTIPNAQLLVGCVDCIAALLPTADVIATGQNVLDEFGVSCKGTSVPPLTVSINPASGASTATSAVTSSSISFPPVGGNSTTSPLPSSTTTPTVLTTSSRVSQVTVTAGPTSSAADFTPPGGNGALGLSGSQNGLLEISVGVIAGIVLGLT